MCIRDRSTWALPSRGSRASLNYDDVNQKLNTYPLNQSYIAEGFMPVMIPPPDMTCIIEPTYTEGGLFLGNMGDAMDLELLQKCNITSVLSVADETNIIYPRTLIKSHLKVNYVVDSPYFDIKPYFNDCIDFIERRRKKGDNVLVHCMAGISRSATVVIAYMMKVYGYSVREAFKYIASLRPIIKPNSGFYYQLREFEQELFNVISK
eukprot:TRINITY_DN5277_c0_g1_i1.p1 TRINITY_DN5277_c0_g1~~TRINITY_DN5277_c0_g1_i1.p1  ORF type:complete len:223 (+),score=38.34 TRINITY_DN5277_c0_g1_i1:49-669(+)